MPEELNRDALLSRMREAATKMPRTDSPPQLVIGGGGALILAYLMDRGTKDLEGYERSRDFELAVWAAMDEYGHGSWFDSVFRECDWFPPDFFFGNSRHLCWLPDDSDRRVQVLVLTPDALAITKVAAIADPNGGGYHGVRSEKHREDIRYLIRECGLSFRTGAELAAATRAAYLRQLDPADLELVTRELLG